MDRKSKWVATVDRVFNTMPRDGTDNATVWLPRRDIEKRLLEILVFQGVHICIDGSSGTGKTSLVTTQLHRTKQKYVLIQLTKSMTWVDFCRRLVTPPTSVENTVKADTSVGLKNFLPEFSFRISLRAKTNRVADMEAFYKAVSTWGEADVCKALMEQEAALFIDDFENASADLIHRVADMMKLFTQSFKGKIIVVGIGGAYSDLLEANPQLEGRLEEITVPTLKTQLDSWTFLCMGFDKLMLGNPARDAKEKWYHLTSKDQLSECVRYAFDAADGLPKALNELGRDISIMGFGRKRISHSDIKSAAKKMLDRNIAQCERRFPEILHLLKSRTEARLVLKHMFECGIGSVQLYSDISNALASQLSIDQVSVALEELVSAKLITKTGLRGERLFSANPTLTHTLGVLIEAPEKYTRSPSVFAPIGQLKLPFSFDEQRFETELTSIKEAVQLPYWVE